MSDNMDMPVDRATHIALVRGAGMGGNTLCGVPIEDVNHHVLLDPKKPPEIVVGLRLPLCSTCDGEFTKLQKPPAPAKRERRRAPTGTCSCGGTGRVAATPGRPEDGPAPCPQCYPGQKRKAFDTVEALDAWMSENPHLHISAAFYAPPYSGAGLAIGSGRVHVIYEEARPRGA